MFPKRAILCLEPDKIDLMLQLILDICILGTLKPHAFDLGKFNLIRSKRGCPKGLKNNFQGQMKVFQGPQDTNIKDQLQN